MAIHRKVKTNLISKKYQPKNASKGGKESGLDSGGSWQHRPLWLFSLHQPRRVHGGDHHSYTRKSAGFLKKELHLVIIIFFRNICRILLPCYIQEPFRQFVFKGFVF